jgi:hypothetical protein
MHWNTELFLTAVGTYELCLQFRKRELKILEAVCVDRADKEIEGGNAKSGRKGGKCLERAAGILAQQWRFTRPD